MDGLEGCFVVFVVVVTVVVAVKTVVVVLFLVVVVAVKITVAGGGVKVGYGILGIIEGSHGFSSTTVEGVYITYRLT